MSLLDVQGVSRSFGRRAILRDVDLRMEAGERVAVRGPNGSGKTTLLRLVAGTLRPTAGTIHINGNTGRRARAATAYVPHDAPAYRELSPAEHLRFAAGLHGHSLGAGDAAGLLRDAGLAKQAHRAAGQLSRGQRQRMLLATALACQPQLLILDEPTTALDDDGRTWLADRLQAFEGAVLAAVHDDALTWNRTLTIAGGTLR